MWAARMARAGQDRADHVKAGWGALGVRAGTLPRRIFYSTVLVAYLSRVQYSGVSVREW